jgi:hypothetical protein
LRSAHPTVWLKRLSFSPPKSFLTPAMLVRTVGAVQRLRNFLSKYQAVIFDEAAHVDAVTNIQLTARCS